ncbi:MAG TPA: fumarylacetoacetate hydrolase family protein [Geminicoccaceae bacterium]|nr:fumarylacetoacetate hydrolase family protein [Geminicoccaceae bacterium]
MVEQTKAERIAAHIFAAHQRKEWFQRLRGEHAPASLDEAYVIQDEVHRLFSAAGWGGLGGHKIALTSRAVQELCGVDQPAGGAIFARTIHQSPATVRLADFMHLGLEFELGVRLGADLPASGAPYTRESVAPAVAACMPAFELIEDRGADYGDLDAASILTDKCWCGGVVLGPEVAAWHDLDLARAPALLSWNGEVVDRGVTGAAMGHPFEGLAWLANLLAARGRGMKAGEIVITGSALRTRFPEAGDEITYRIAGLGETTVRIVAQN